VNENNRELVTRGVDSLLGTLMTCVGHYRNTIAGSPPGELDLFFLKK
jgi:hypothetical protein